MIDFNFNKNAHRTDSSTLPVITALGIVNVGKIKLGEQNYARISNGRGFTWNVANRTHLKEVCLKNVFRPSWVRDEGIDPTSGGDLIKSGATAFTGAYFIVNQSNCGIEAKTVSTSLTAAISLQTGSVSQDFFTSADVEHCIVFGNGGLASVYEKGAAKTAFPYLAGDTGLIEKRGDIVKYYKISADGVMTLIRSTRSKLIDADIKACVLLYPTGAALDSIFVWSGEEIKKPFQIFAVLEEFQDWSNAGTLESLGETTYRKDKRPLVTFFSGQRTLRSLAVNLEWRFIEEYKEFENFYIWHDLDKEFIFKDLARKIEFFANFSAPLQDNPLGADIFGLSSQIREMVNPPNLLIF
jgi:hypothetical protein